MLEPTVSQNGHASDRDAEPGRWLPLQEAIREVGSLERLYHLSMEGSLLSRQGADGEIEVWVADRESYRAPATAIEDDVSDDAIVVAASSTVEGDNTAVALLGRLVEAHERQLTLARENGTLSARVANLERELDEVRAHGPGSISPLVESYERQLEVVRENGALAERAGTLARALDEARAAAAGNQVALTEAQERHVQLAQENGVLNERLAVMERDLEEHRARPVREGIRPPVPTDPGPSFAFGADALRKPKIGRELALDDEPALKATSIASTDRSVGGKTRSALVVLLVLLMLAVIIAVSVGAGWAASRVI